MSSILFHSRNETSRLSSAERAFFALQVAEATAEVLSALPDETLAKAMPSERLTVGDRWRRAEELRRIFMSTGGRDAIRVGDDKAAPWILALNTAIRVGRERDWDPLILAARLHGQCEVHCWVDGPNRTWLTEIIHLGLRAGTFRLGLRGHSLGWETVVEQLRNAPDGPIVCSYSVTESFPSRSLCFLAGLWSPDGDPGHNLDDWTDEQWDAWYDVPGDEQWQLGMEALRREPLLELRPDNFREYYFGNGLSAFDLTIGRVSP